MPGQRYIPAAERLAGMPWPKQGLDVSTAYSEQPAFTTAVGRNVRTFDPRSNRARGATRNGISKYIPVQPAGSQVIQHLQSLVGTGYTPPGGATQSSTSGRVVNLIAVVGGNVYIASPGGSTWATATNLTAFTPPLIAGGAPPLSASPVLYSSPNIQKLWFADGTHWAYYDPSVNQILTWTASVGTLPTDSAGNTPRLITTWRGRTVLSGLPKDPQNWFMSATLDPTNWNYAPATVIPTQAVAGNNSTLGLVGDLITTMIPYTDDQLIFGGDSSIWVMRGDPMLGGRIDLLSDSIGMAWGQPWCKAPDGTVYFLSNRTGIYRMLPGQGPPERISQRIEHLLELINTGTFTVKLIWDDAVQGLHVFVTCTTVKYPNVHYFWEERTGSWWQDSFVNSDQDPLTACVFDGNLSTDRRVVIGSWDGYVRSLDLSATNDDGTGIDSAIAIGPILAPTLDEMMLKDVQCDLGTASGPLTYSVYVGATAEAALSTAAVVSGTWRAGRNLTSFIRRAGHAIYVQLSAANHWEFEAMRIRAASRGRIRMRGA